MYLGLKVNKEDAMVHKQAIPSSNLAMKNRLYEILAILLLSLNP
jgi:hypothetical protein